MPRIFPTLVLASAALVAAVPARAQTAADSAAIRAAALDYVEGWYAGDGARMDERPRPHGHLDRLHAPGEVERALGDRQRALGVQAPRGSRGEVIFGASADCREGTPVG